MSKVEKLFSNSTVGIASKAMNALVRMLCLPVLIHVYGKGQYGLIAIAMSLNTFVAILQLGMPTGIPKFVAEWVAKRQTQVMEKATRTVFTFYLVVALVNVILILLIRYFFVSHLKIHPEQIDILKALLIVTAIASFISIPVNFVDQLLSGVQDIAFISKMQMIKNVIFAGLVFFAYLNPQKLSVVEFYILNSIIMFCMVPAKLLRWLRYSSLRVFIPGWDFKSIIPLLKYSISLLAMAVFTILAVKLKPIILSSRVSEDAAKHMTDFQIINYVGLFLMMISSSFLAALVPYVSHEFATGNMSVYKKVIQDATKPVWAVGALIGFGMILLSRELLIVYVGVENLYLQKWLTLLLCSVLFNLYYPCIASVILSSGRTLPLTAINGIACIVSLCVCWFLCPITAMGSMVIAQITYISIIFIGTHVYYLPKCFSISPVEQITKILMPPVFAGVVMVLSVRYMLDHLGITDPYLIILFGAIAGTLVYSAIILSVYIKPAEIILLANKVRKK